MQPSPVNDPQPLPARIGVTLFEQRPRAAVWLERGVAPLDRWFNRLYGSRLNPLYQSGTVAVLLLFVLIATGLYLLIFYKISTPYESVSGIEGQVWAGRWIRALHSYAGDGMMIAVLVHAMRMLIGGRTWGPRVLAWLTGVVLLGIMLLSGWTGLVLVWDLQSQLVATEGARLLDVLPLFSEPIQRTFTSSAGLPSSFFFLNLLLHMVFPVVVLLGVWLHTSRLARPAFLPPKPLSLWLIGALLALSLVWPLGMLPQADPLRLLGRVPVDGFYAAWLALARNLPPLWTLVAMTLAMLLPLSVPLWWRPANAGAPLPAQADPMHCTGCSQCYKDCPYEAIRMVDAPAENTATDLVARVDPALCVACGICAGSCAPMIVGPPGRRGRDLVQDIQRFHSRVKPTSGSVAALVCRHSAGAQILDSPPEGVHVYALHCAGASHTSQVEYLLRRGVGGVYLLACPGRDCFYRTGPIWLHERLFNYREAELQERVDRTRVRYAQFARAEWPAALADLKAFRAAALAVADQAVDEGEVDLNTLCEAIQG